MKKNILYVLLGGLLLSLAACSENWEDATSKPVSYTHLTLPTTERV